MRRPSAPLLLLACLAALMTTARAQDEPAKRAPEGDVPLLRDIPLLGHLFKNQKTLWYPLEDENPGGGGDLPAHAATTRETGLSFK